jgi:hypothetical protein
MVGCLVKESTGKVEKTERWYSDGERDVREVDEAVRGLARFVSDCNPRVVVSPDVIIGCPHEEGIDYPEGGVCPECPFWAGRDRFSGGSPG